MSDEETRSGKPRKYSIVQIGALQQTSVKEEPEVIDNQRVSVN